MKALSSQLRTQLRERRTTHAVRRSFVRDVALSSHAQLSEMEAILGRYDDAPDIAALRTIVQQARTAA